MAAAADGTHPTGMHSCCPVVPLLQYFTFMYVRTAAVLRAGQFQNNTLEERVELLEIQVVVIQDEVSDLETNIDFLFDEQVIQDERLLNLEETSAGILGELDVIDDAIEGEK